MSLDVATRPDLRDVAWTAAAARQLSGDKEFVRVAPADVRKPAEMEPRSHAVLESVVESMRVVGQLVPIIISAEDHELIDGATRLEAAKRLGLPFVAAMTVASLDDLEQVALRFMSNADAYRASFTVLEAVALSNKYQALLSDRAKRNKSLNGQRQAGANFAGGSGVPNFGSPELEQVVGDAAKVASELVPVSHETVRKVNAITRWAEDASQPEEVRDVAARALEQIARTNKVDGAYKQVQKVAAAHAEDDLRDIASQSHNVAQAWCDLDIALVKAEELLKVDTAEVVKFGHTADDAHKVFIPRLMAIRDWIDAYERACR